MDIILFMVAGATVLFCIGVLVGSGLNTRCVDRRCRRAARLVQHLNESDAVMNGRPAKYRAGPAHHQTTPRRSPSAEEYPVDGTAAHRGELGSAAQPR